MSRLVVSMAAGADVSNSSAAVAVGDAAVMEACSPPMITPTPALLVLLEFIKEEGLLLIVIPNLSVCGPSL